MISQLQIFAQKFPNPISNNLSISAGIENRKTDFRWSIAGNTSGTSPNIYSEIIYNPIISSGFFIDGSYRIYKKLGIEISYNKNFTYKGSATDIDYGGDNRTQYIPPAYGDTLFESNKGGRHQLQGILKYILYQQKWLELAAGLGYSKDVETFYLLDKDNPALASTYKATWNGPIFSASGNIQIKRKIQLQPKVSYLPMKFKGTANWNLQEEFVHPVSFIQHANGSGWNYGLTATYQLHKNWGINLEGIGSNWKTDKGIDELFLKNGESPKTQMNGAFKKSTAIKLSTTYVF